MESCIPQSPKVELVLPSVLQCVAHRVSFDQLPLVRTDDKLRVARKSALVRQVGLGIFARIRYPAVGPCLL